MRATRRRRRNGLLEVMYLRGMNLSTFASAYVAGKRDVPRPKHVFIAVADHYEPEWNNAAMTVQRDRVNRWVNEYPVTVEGCCDSRGCSPQHTFFYPVECYQAEHLDKLAGLVRAGYGDVEVHLHHDDDTVDSLRQMLIETTHTLHHQHGLLHKDASGAIRYGFVHGNWALNNSHPDGRWCGVNDEISVLQETGCYADFTMPAAPHRAQTKIINSLYYATGDPHRPKSHDTGQLACVGCSPPSDRLLMVQGPLVVRHQRPWLKPRIENGNVTSTQPLSPRRIDDWLRARVAVAKHPSWQFIKLHTHGAKPINADVWLGESATLFHRGLQSVAQRYGFQYYYVTAREMAILIGQAEQGIKEPQFDF